MIDREARDRTADAIQRLARGKHDYETVLERFQANDSNCLDRGVTGILMALDGVDEPKIEVEYIDEKDRIDLLRCASFLRTDLEYEWPDVPFPRGHADAWGCLAGFGAVIAAVIFLFAIESFGAMFVVPFLWLVVACWVEGRISDRTFAAQLARHRSEGRELNVWPFSRRGDLPPGTEGLIDTVDET